jgi:hygromycin-B 4-O-kinase
MQSADHTGSIHPSALDPDTVLAFLRARFRGDVEPRSVERITHGEWSKAFFFGCADGSEFVVRFSARDEDFRKDQLAIRFGSARLPVRRLLEIGQAFNGFYAIAERVYGEFIEQRDGAAMKRLLPSLFATFDACREADLSDTAGFGIWKGDGSAPHATWRDALLSSAIDAPTNRTYGWQKRLRESDVGQRAFDAGYKRFEALIDACPNQRYLLHSDLLYFNILVHNDQISAVLDWGSSMYGDFLWDLAWITFWQPWYQQWSSVDFRRAAREHYASIGVEVPNFEERMRCYELAIGLDGLAYQAFAGHWDNLAWTSRRLLGLLSRGSHER